MEVADVKIFGVKNQGIRLRNGDMFISRCVVLVGYTGFKKIIGMV